MAVVLMYCYTNGQYFFFTITNDRVYKSDEIAVEKKVFERNMDI